LPKDDKEFILTFTIDSRYKKINQKQKPLRGIRG
jgi:hypothetical protein